MAFAQRLAFCIAVMAPIPAIAQPGPLPAPKTLESDLQQWLADRLGPHAAGSLRIHVTHEGDHDRVAVADARTAVAGATASVRAGADGRWLIDDLEIPSVKFTRSAGKDATDFAFKVGTQNSRARVDPSLASPSSLDLDLHDLGLTGHGAELSQDEQIDHLDVHARLAPEGQNYAFEQHAVLAGWRSASHPHGAPAIAVGAENAEAGGHIGGLDHHSAEAVLATVAGLLMTLPANAAPGQAGSPLPPAVRAALTVWLDALQRPTTEMHGEETIGGLHVAVEGRGDASLNQVHMVADLHAPQGLAEGQMEIRLDGLHVAGLPPDAAALVPPHVVLRPTVAGVPVADLATLILRATDPGADRHRLEADAHALLTKPGVVVGLNALHVSLGPATLAGHGKMTLTDHDGYQVEAHLTATGFDVLMAQVAGKPALQQMIPILAVMRGFSRPDGNGLVWDVVAHNDGLTVNGMPLSANGHAHIHPGKR